MSGTQRCYGCGLEWLCPDCGDGKSAPVCWHIVETDNFDGDYPSESFAALGIADKRDAERIADLFNERQSGPTAQRYWKAVANGYKLRSGPPR